uniref:Uncharacterized protein n=1 Tax=Strombidium rassoulzadegani TaxID=1082188 RepID=A0A7S3FXY5_9SPIT|mmetsp:Transcript_9293/g.15652  ORF Transcript_9293/g.15652 Transcript_9293/m.15652 type:complete len:184 (+) Transcript_9293:332-883(+)
MSLLGNAFNSSNCSISAVLLDYQDYFDLTNSFIFSLIHHPVEDSDNCTMCAFIGDSVGAIQESIVALEASRKMWEDPNAIKKLEFWPQTSRLLFLYLMFVSAFVNIDKIYKYPPVKAFLDELFSKFDFSIEIEVIINMVNSWNRTEIMLAEIPGLTCKQIGARIGLSLRFLFNVVLEEVLDDA